MTNPSIQVSVTNETSDSSLDESRLREAVLRVLARNSIDSATVGVAIVNDEAIHALNREYLQHDYPTDVLSFPLVVEGNSLEGEIVVSLDTAAAQAASFGWLAEDELLLYVVHGALHLVGYDDKSETAAAEMRSKEIEILADFGLTPHYDDVTAGRPHSVRS